MDAFKLLTRSTKVKSSQAQTNNLPSAGQQNSELSEEHRGKKRKRGANGNGGSTEDAVKLDFFGLEVPTTAHQDARKMDAGEKKPSPDDKYSTEECKAVLKCHKIKIADLRTPLPRTLDRTSKPSKKKSKAKSEPAAHLLSKKQQKMAQRLYPQPLTSFTQLRSRYQISRRLAENITSQGYSVPTEVQLGSLPLLLVTSNISKAQARPSHEPDLLVIAPTGSGKTLAFMIPLINKIIQHNHDQPQLKGLLSIVLAPTKELVAQIVNEGRKLTAGTGVKVSAMRKGMRIVEEAEDNASILEEHSDSSGDEEDEQEGGASGRKRRGHATVTKSDILVSTPLMLVNSLSGNQKHGITPLPSVQSLVLDEADVLLDPLFREQTLQVWNACTNSDLRVGLWSATMGSNIEELTKATIKDRQNSLGLVDESRLIRLVVGLKDSAIPNISHKLVYAATEQGKLLGLRQILRPSASSASSDTHLRPPFLVFTQTITRAVALHSELKYDIPAEAGGSSRIAVLHSELSDSKRSDVMAGFRKGEIWILITTDLLARGVDFRGINGVVNYDIPNSSAAYVHRVGRTGRAGREGGVAVTFYTKEDIPYVKSIANVIAASEKLRGITGDEGIQKWLLDSLPNLSKKDKKDLKQHGVKVRRPAARAEQDTKEKRKTKISTKSGFERRMENNRRGAIQGSRRRKEREDSGKEDDDDGNGWGGIED